MILVSYLLLFFLAFDVIRATTQSILAVAAASMFSFRMLWIRTLEKDDRPHQSGPGFCNAVLRFDRLINWSSNRFGRIPIDDRLARGGGNGGFSKSANLLGNNSSRCVENVIIASGRKMELAWKRSLGSAERYWELPILIIHWRIPLNTPWSRKYFSRPRSRMIHKLSDHFLKSRKFSFSTKFTEEGTGIAIIRNCPLRTLFIGLIFCFSKVQFG